MTVDKARQYIQRQTVLGYTIKTGVALDQTHDHKVSRLVLHYLSYMYMLTCSQDSTQPAELLLVETTCTCRWSQFQALSALACLAFYCHV